MLAAVEWSQGIENGWTRLVEFVPKLLGFLVILFVGWLIAKAISKAANGVLERVGFDKAVERGGIKKAMAHTKFDASDIVSKVIYYALMLIVLQMAFGVFGPNPVSDLIEGVIAYLPKVLAAILIIVVTAAIAAAVKEIIDAALGGLSYGKTLAYGVSAAIIVIGVFAALDQLQIAPRIVSGLFYALLATIAGSAIIAIGGGGIAPMRRRWEATLERYDQEKARIAAEGTGAKGRIKQRMEERAHQAQAAMAGQPAQQPMPPQGYSQPYASQPGQPAPQAMYEQPMPQPQGQPQPWPQDPNGHGGGSRSVGDY
jgi:hypothetical protein